LALQTFGNYDDAGVEYFSVTGDNGEDGLAEVTTREKDEEFDEYNKDGTKIHYNMSDWNDLPIGSTLKNRPTLGS